jgi:putative DNA methylase
MPLEKINEACGREKSIRHGHPSTLHLWWARRPLAAARAVLFGQLVDDPTEWVAERFGGDTAAAEAEQKRLHDFIEQLVRWENSNDPHTILRARWYIARAVAWNRGEEPPAPDDRTAVDAYLQAHAPPVYDPFCGGGTIPLEAQRLGLRAYGSDLNPVAVLISKALVEIPSKVAGREPVNPDWQARKARGEHWHGTGAQGLAEDIRYYGRRMRERAWERIGHLYPPAEVTEEAVRQQPHLKPLKGKKLTVIAWLWARTVPSPNPALGGVHVPLVNSFALSKKSGRETIIIPETDAKHGTYRFTIKSKDISKVELEQAKRGTKAGKAQDFVCLLSGAVIPRSYIREKGKSGELDERLLAVVTDGQRNRVYLPPECSSVPGVDHESKIQLDTVRKEYLSGKTPTRDMITGGVCSAYGFETWGSLFSDRQTNALTAFSKILNEVSEEANEEQAEYFSYISTYLGLSVGRCSDYWAENCSWVPERETISHTFSRQGLPMIFDYAEANPFSESAGNWNGSAVGWIPKVVERLPANPDGEIHQLDARNLEKYGKHRILATDPPYYDNVAYSELSDYFYSWLRFALKGIQTEVFSTISSPKKDELVAAPHRVGNRKKAEEYFINGMTDVMRKMSENSYEDIPVSVFYAFKQSERVEEGITSTGWATFLNAAMTAGFSIVATLPMRTERAARSVGIGTNALASSIVLVCRKRSSTASSISRSGFLQRLRAELPDALDQLRRAAIAPVDLQQAAIGPGMAVFSRYREVLERDDTRMSVRTALSLINQVKDEVLSAGDSEFDAETRFAIAWFEQHAFETANYGEAEVLATANALSVHGIREAGLIHASAGKVRLLTRAELPADWDPASDARATVWEATQHLIRTLEQNSEADAARLLAQLRAADLDRLVNDLAYRLYEICNDKKWAEEGRAYNMLGSLWSDISNRAEDFADQTGPAQGSLGFGG